MTTTFETAKIGDRVWCMRNGWGEILGASGLDDYPIAVRFKGDGFKTYTLGGFYSEDEVTQSLFWDEVMVVAPKKPLPALKKDTKVLVWNDDGPKHKSYFAGWCAINGLIMTYDYGATSWSSIGFSTWQNWELAE